MNKAEKEAFKTTCYIMVSEIRSVYKSFGIRIMCKSVKFIDGCIDFQIVPDVGVRVKTVMSYDKDVALHLGMDVKLKLMGEDGCIGVVVSIYQFMNRMKHMINEDRYSHLYKKIEGIESVFQNYSEPIGRPRELDKLFEEAGYIATSRRYIYAVMIQKYLKINRYRAEVIMNQLCYYGVVGEGSADNPREVLMNREQFEQLIKELKKF